MTRKTNRREFVQVAGLAASGFIAAADPLAGAIPEPQARPAAQARPAPGTMGARFRALLNGPEPLICPGAYDVLTARLIEVHGFKAVFVGSSAANVELLALPDQAIVTVSEIIAYDSVIASNVDIPVVADVDDFGATPLNVYRFAKQAEKGGIACAAFDDRMPLNRAAAYSEAGADLVWIGLPTAQDYVKAADMIKKPLFGVIGGANFPATPAAMKAARMTVGQTGPVVNIALGAVDKALTEIQATGRMTEAQKGALNRATSEKVERA